MPKDLHLEIVSPDRIIYEGLVKMIQVPGQKGRFTLLRHHAPIIAFLTEGEITVVGKNGIEDTFKCTRGVLECRDNEVTILIGGLE